MSGDSQEAGVDILASSSMFNDKSRHLDNTTGVVGRYIMGFFCFTIFGLVGFHSLGFGLEFSPSVEQNDYVDMATPW